MSVLLLPRYGRTDKQHTQKMMSNTRDRIVSYRARARLLPPPLMVSFHISDAVPARICVCRTVCKLPEHKEKKPGARLVYVCLFLQFRVSLHWCRAHSCITTLDFRDANIDHLAALPAPSSVCTAMFWFECQRRLNTIAVYLLVLGRWSQTQFMCAWALLLPHLIRTVNCAQDHLSRWT